MSLESLFNPESIAVVGAARERTKVGNIVLRNLSGSFDGRLYAVNPAADSVEGFHSYKSLTDIPSGVDLAVVAVPRAVVPQVADDAARAGVRSAIVITSGFRELDEEGARLEEELRVRAAKAGFRVLGPNTLGLITPRFNATFSYSDVKLGGLALVTQSGGIGVYMLNWAHRTRTGLSHFVSLGNQCDIKEAEVYSYLSSDPQTKAIFSYNEGVADGKAFLEHVPEVASKKPIVFLKGGVGKEGAEAVKTHTGSLAGSAELFKAAVESVGGIYVENLEEFLNMAKIVLASENPNPNILVVTNSGGHGVLAADEIERQKLNLVKLPQKTAENLRKVLPTQSSAKNPLDLSGDADAERYRAALKEVAGVDCTKIVLVQSLPTVSCSEVARVLLDFKNAGVIGVVMGLDEDAAVRTLESADIPAYRFPEDAVRSLKSLLNRLPPTKKVQAPGEPKWLPNTAGNRSQLGDADCFKMFEAYGIRTAKWGVASSVEEAMSLAETIGFPVVMKMSAEGPVHKTELGGVRVNVEKEDVPRVFQELSRLASRVLVQEQLSGVEVFMGGVDDPAFGKAVAVGLGGIYVEVLRSVSYGLCPVGEDEARRMIAASRVQELLTARNRKYNVDAVVDDLVKLSKLMVDLDVKQLDVNPLMVTQSG
ncbi:MAG: acetate--CoA ligase family protein, partial [Thermoprotei archaeon]